MPTHITHVRTPQTFLFPNEVRLAGAAHEADVAGARVDSDAARLSPTAFAQTYGVQLAPGGRLTKQIVDDVKRTAALDAFVHVDTTPAHHVVVTEYDAPRSPTLSGLQAASEQKKSPIDRAFAALGLQRLVGRTLPDETLPLSTTTTVPATEAFVPNPYGSTTWSPTIEVDAGKGWKGGRFGQHARLEGRDFILEAHGDGAFVGEVTIGKGGRYGTLTLVVAIHDGDVAGERLVSIVPAWQERARWMVGRPTTTTL